MFAEFEQAAGNIADADRLTADLRDGGVQNAHREGEQGDVQPREHR